MRALRFLFEKRIIVRLVKDSDVSESNGEGDTNTNED